jgi:undecaprenyl diphosphate synthase
MTQDNASGSEGGVKTSALPQHVGIIMDGNGRWARERGQPRSFGHKNGIEALRNTIRFAAERGIAYLTLYAFSSENWNRPADEISDLFGLMKIFVKKYLAELHTENVRVRIIGAPEDFSEDILALIENAETLTKNNTGLQLIIALNYGSRQEITRAAVKLAKDVAKGKFTPDSITPEFFGRYLDTANIPDPDLIIRTSGEQRLSNFLLWQSAYAELIFLPVLWPDFDGKWFDRALEDYASRERRYGGLARASRVK